MMRSFRGPLRLVLIPESVWNDENSAGHFSKSIARFVLDFSSVAYAPGGATDLIGDMRAFLESFFKQLKTIILTTESFPIYVRLEHANVRFGPGDHLLVQSYKSGRESLQELANFPVLTADDKATMYQQIQEVTNVIQRHEQAHLEVVRLYEEYCVIRDRLRRARLVAKRLERLGVRRS